MVVHVVVVVAVAEVVIAIGVVVIVFSSYLSSHLTRLAWLHDYYCCIRQTDEPSTYVLPVQHCHLATMQSIASATIPSYCH